VQTCPIDPGSGAGWSPDVWEAQGWPGPGPFAPSRLAALKIACIDMAASTDGMVGGGV